MDVRNCCVQFWEKIKNKKNVEEPEKRKKGSTAKNKNRRDF